MELLVEFLWDGSLSNAGWAQVETVGVAAMREFNKQCLWRYTAGSSKTPSKADYEQELRSNFLTRNHAAEVVTLLTNWRQSGLLRHYIQSLPAEISLRFEITHYGTVERVAQLVETLSVTLPTQEFEDLMTFSLRLAAFNDRLDHFIELLPWWEFDFSNNLATVLHGKTLYGWSLVKVGLRHRPFKVRLYVEAFLSKDKLDRDFFFGMLQCVTPGVLEGRKFIMKVQSSQELAQVLMLLDKRQPRLLTVQHLLEFIGKWLRWNCFNNNIYCACMETVWNYLVDCSPSRLRERAINELARAALCYNRPDIIEEVIACYPGLSLEGLIQPGVDSFNAATQKVAVAALKLRQSAEPQLRWVVSVCLRNKHSPGTLTLQELLQLELLTPQTRLNILWWLGCINSASAYLTPISRWVAKSDDHLTTAAITNLSSPPSVSEFMSVCERLLNGLTPGELDFGLGLSTLAKGKTFWSDFCRLIYYEGASVCEITSQFRHKLAPWAMLYGRHRLAWQLLEASPRYGGDKSLVREAFEALLPQPQELRP